MKSYSSVLEHPKKLSRRSSAIVTQAQKNPKLYLTKIGCVL
ncbi:hypothetical protein NSE_0610 [Neorickettsia sennetsu str. Miyayama]|uniref:Uncharacterized protein n=1 Tax=Ehrlichia sennetsu (strain ATCC VR-367 / Miyayama) TaxID=222891 RepID=Q2GDF6_EHRS3|nr:hypothetical protein NSE_0610 [Neorickettsia sennetsu str. Miyayama]